MITRRPRILIADDEAIGRRILAATLTAWGYEVVETASGTEAWSVLQDQDAPPLAILDIMMPGLDGVEICRKVRLGKSTSPTYIILLTARTGKKELITGLQAGADDYLTKPFDREELYARVEVGRRVVELQESLAERVSQLERAETELRRLSLTDDLTGLSNRRGFLRDAKHQLKLARRIKTQSLLVYADMDGLKQINDTFGHEQGSIAISQVADILKQTFRETDLIARLGGDEFAILALHANCDDPETIRAHLAETLRNSSAKSREPYALSLSLGIMLIGAEATDSLEESLIKADHLMYAEKRRKKEATGPGTQPNLLQRTGNFPTTPKTGTTAMNTLT